LISEKWEAPLQQFDLPTSIPRFVPKISIFVEDKRVFCGGDILRKECNLESFLVAILLAFHEDGSKTFQYQEEFRQIYAHCQDLTAVVNHFIARIPKDHKVLKLMKCCNQTIVSPAIMYMKQTFGKQFPFKDVPQSWFIRVHISKKGITVIHKKSERSNSDQDFTFEWTLHLFFDAAFTTLERTQLLVEDIATDDQQLHQKISKTLGSCCELNCSYRAK
jgi:hypothetical protein